MRILHVVTNSDLGGAPRVVTELSARAVRDGHECAVAATPDGPMWPRLDSRIRQYPLPDMRRAVEPASDLRTFLHLRKIYRDFRPDIIHLHSSKAGVLGRLAALASGRSLWRRCVYTIHGFDTILKTHRKFLPVERFLARRCGAVVPVSRYDETSLKAVGIEGNIVPVHNGASDRRGMASPDPAAAARLAAASAEGRPVVLSIARLEPPKRPDLFVDLARRFPGASFFWVGNIQPPETMLPPGSSLPPNTHFLGESPEAGCLANLCDIFLLLSDYEGLPMSILEAMSCARPVVASAVGGILEALDGGAGMTVPNDGHQIGERLKMLLDSPEERERFGRAARARFESDYSADRMWSGYLKLYTALITE